MSPLVTQPPDRETGRILDLSYPNAFQNLALEEALAKSNLGSSITVRLWENPPSVILGRFQNPTDEVNIGFCNSMSIKIARRFTGGGAVYHDLGNLNFTIAGPRPKNCSVSKLHNDYAGIILGALKAFGIDGNFAPPNSIEVSGKKISGGAAWMGRQNMLWHASILVSTNTQILTQILSPSTTLRSTNFVRSKKQVVTTLEQVVGKSADLTAVKRELIDNCVRRLGFQPQNAPLTENETSSMMRLFAEKYSKDDWNLHGHWGDQQKK